jgi:hypothetical protein
MTQHLLLHITLTGIVTVGWFDSAAELRDHVPSGISKLVHFMRGPDCCVYVAVAKYAGWQKNRLRASHAALMECRAAGFRAGSLRYADY